MSTSASPKKATPAKKVPQTADHPPFVEMISEAIVENADRTGISRAGLKKYMETRWKIEFTPTLNSQLNRSIKSGADKGTFSLPKGPSGKVKLAAKNDSAKENKPISKGSKTKAPAKAATKAAPTKAVTAKASKAKAAPKAAPTAAAVAKAKVAAKAVKKGPVSKSKTKVRHSVHFKRPKVLVSSRDPLLKKKYCCPQQVGQICHHQVPVMY